MSSGNPATPADNRPWLGWVLLSLVVAAAIVAIHFNEAHRQLEAAERQVDTEMTYLGYIVDASLQTGDYEQAQEQIEAWGSFNMDTVSLQLTADNGFVIGRFERPRPDDRLAVREQVIRFSYQGAATLRLKKSLAPVDRSIAALGWQLFAGFVVFELLGILLVYQFRRLQQQNRISQLEYERRLEAQAALKRMATLDALTGLPNRRRLDEQLQLRISEASRFDRQLALLFVDLDNFKTINDSFGHATGDQLLKVVARQMSQQLRDYDLLARFGGDEFVIMLTNLGNPAEIQNVADKLIGTFDAPVRIDARELFISCSVGISLYPQNGNTASDLLRTADAAMYTAKDAGKNCYRFYTPALNDSVAERQKLEFGLRHALEKHELYLLYQPIVDLRSERIVGCEALLRWHAATGDMAPGDFLAVAQQSALMLQIQTFVINEAARQRAEWNRRGLNDFRVHVNLSGSQRLISDAFPKLLDAFDRDDLAAGDMGVEVREATLTDDNANTLSNLNYLRKVGCCVSLDGYGMAHALLDNLKSLPLDTLNIDRTLIQRLPDEEVNRAVVKAIISTGHSTKKTVLAEGVETKAQLDLVRNQGCDYAQGFYLYRPMPAAQLEELLFESAAGNGSGG